MKFDIEADWSLNRLCNYSCDYCSAHAPREHDLVGRISPEEYLDFFDSTGKTWLLHITGGEPFHYPNFVGLCRTLAQRHYLSLNSNLCAHGVRAFAAQIDPARVQFVHCAVHLEQRDLNNGWHALQGNVEALLERGFPVFASLVMTPAAFAGLERAAEFFTAIGVPLIPKSIRGVYEGRWYPQAYTAEERGQFLRYSELAKSLARNGGRRAYRHDPAIDPLIDRDYLDGFPDFTGIPCSAGSKVVSIAPDGNVFRCGPQTILGNIHERRLNLYAADRPCNDEFCAVYYCLRYSRFTRPRAGNFPRQTAPSVLRQVRIISRNLRRKI